MSEEKEDMIEEVKNRSKEEAQQILDRARKVADKEISMAKTKAREIKQKKEQEFREKFNKQKKRNLTQVNIEFRQRKISAQHELVQKMFQTALDELFKMKRDKEYFNILKKLILDAVEIIDKKNTIIYLNKKDRDFINQDDNLDKLRDFLKNEYDQKSDIEISNDSINISGGVLVTSEDGKVRYHNTFEDILDRKKDELEADILEELFKWGIKG